MSFESGSILFLAPKFSFQRKILKAYFIKTLTAIWNNQLLTLQERCHLVSVP